MMPSTLLLPFSWRFFGMAGSTLGWGWWANWHILWCQHMSCIVSDKVTGQPRMSDTGYKPCKQRQPGSHVAGSGTQLDEIWRVECGRTWNKFVVTGVQILFLTDPV